MYIFQGHPKNLSTISKEKVCPYQDIKIDFGQKHKLILRLETMYLEQKNLLTSLDWEYVSESKLKVTYVITNLFISKTPHTSVQ